MFTAVPRSSGSPTLKSVGSIEVAPSTDNNIGLCRETPTLKSVGSIEVRVKWSGRFCPGESPTLKSVGSIEVKCCVFSLPHN